MLHNELGHEKTGFLHICENKGSDQLHFNCAAALRERLRSHKVLTEDQCFKLNYHKFSIKSYGLDVY